ncbi:MAG: MBOAT family O-acyltransferase [Chthoniobacter sp.]|nr:MBOAT family O-acyltransferase [Chthoniobacter sp.]
MLFVEFRFLFFFALVFGVHWTLRSNTARKWWLLFSSHFFYACFFIGEPIAFFTHLAHGEWSQLPAGWWFPAVLWGSTCMDYAVGLGIADASSEGRRKAWLLASLVVNLGVLCFFKYFNFFLSSAAGFLDWVGLHTSLHTLSIILPYGVSFYTFQSMSYSIDVYRRRLEPVRRFLDLAFFISFFPQLVAGPIVRAMTFLPQVFEKRVWANVDVRGCVTLFFIGFVKKACVSEFAAPFSDQFFTNPEKYSHAGALLGVFFYAVQIYCDFSGYTDMAIATARLLGYELTLNFDFPYFSSSITEFWRRWHISLSTWLRDYLYISLGGNRGSKLFTYRNLMLTMLLGGLWHGASWNFVIWGGLHGLALIVHREWTRLTENAGVLFRRVLALLAVPLTFYWVCVTWIFFRAAPTYNEKTHALEATGLHNALAALKAFTFTGGRGKTAFSVECLGIFALFALVHWLNSRRILGTWWRRLPDWACAVLLGVGLAVALLFVPVKYKPFIYFQF